jgi:hypothetical protein
MTEWRILHRKVLYSLYSSHNIVMMINEGCITCWGNEKCVQNFCRKTWKKEGTWKI